MTRSPSLSARIGRGRLGALLRSRAKGTREAVVEAEILELLTDHLQSLRVARLIQPYEGLANRRLKLVDSWNLMWSTDAQQGLRGAREVASQFGHHLIFIHLIRLASGLRRAPVDDSKFDEALDEVMAKINRGDARWWHIGSREADLVSGEEFDYEIRSWNLVIGRRTDRSNDLQPVEDLPPAELHSFEICLPTGRCILAPSLVTEALAPDFAALVDVRTSWRVGLQMENEREAERYARDYGFVSVASAYDRLTVLADATSIIVCRYFQDGEYQLPEGFRVLRDLLVIDSPKVWFADRSTLITLFTSIRRVSQARQIVEEVERDRRTLLVDLPEGRYRVLSSGRGTIKGALEEGHPLKIPGFDPVMIIEPGS
ncbi:hypothetical protein [Sphingomonas sp. 3-13AW]|uniref:hypothetical protein n=1 Tax=Sphingomonas sp. 3-13AW TaxID=3050450 RepID=UPI003BB6A4D3